MSLAFTRVRVYLRVAVVAGLVCAIGLVLFKNRGNTVTFWFFGLTDAAKPLNVVWLIVWTASSTLLVARVFWFARGIWREFRELKELEVAKATAEAQTQRAAELDERERRVEEKLKSAGLDDPAQDDQP